MSFQKQSTSAKKHRSMALDKRLAGESGPAGEGGGRDRSGDRPDRGPRALGNALDTTVRKGNLETHQNLRLPSTAGRGEPS